MNETATSTPLAVPAFFPCKVYFDTLKAVSKPTFSFVSDQDHYGLAEVFHAVRRQNFRYIFVLINGQQIPTFDANFERDRLFGQPLTGIHRELERGLWRGKCRIYSDPGFPSVAATLWQEYRGQALVLDILNPKYEWQDISNENSKALNYIAKLILDIMRCIEKNHQTQPQMFITGYSRGGVFALRLTRMLKAYVTIKTLVTLDPVISEISEAESLCVGWGIKEKNRWKILWEPKLYGIHLSADSFPILGNPGVPCYNVFQRKAFLAFNSILEKPIGSAVHGATAPNSGIWKPKAPAIRPPFDQYDLELKLHSGVLEKYSSWIMDIAHHECPL